MTQDDGTKSLAIRVRGRGLISMLEETVDNGGSSVGGCARS